MNSFCRHPFISSSPLPFVHFLLLVILFFSAASATHDTISRACTNASAADLNIHYPFCVSALHAAAPPPQPQPPPHKNGSNSSSHHHHDLSPLQLAVLATRSAATNATRTKSRIRKLLATDKVKADTYVKARLEDCLDLFSSAIPALREAARDVKAGLLDDANAQISAAMDGATTCQDGFKEGRGRGVKDNPVDKNCRDLFQLGAICLAIISLV